jgi:opacity protein-like surface antigen
VKKSVLTTVIALLAAGPLSAETLMSWDGRWQVSIGASQFSSDWEFTTWTELNDPQPTTAEIEVSYGIRDNAALFLGYTEFDYVKQARLSGSLGTPQVNVDIISLGLRGYIPFSENMYGFGHIGLAKVSHQEVHPAVTWNSSSTNPMGGIGLGMFVTDNVFTEIAYDMYGENGGTVNGTNSAVKTEYSSLSWAIGYQF